MVRLVAAAAGEAPEAHPAEHLSTLRRGQLVNDHADRLYRKVGAMPVVAWGTPRKNPRGAAPLPRSSAPSKRYHETASADA